MLASKLDFIRSNSSPTLTVIEFAKLLSFKYLKSVVGPTIEKHLKNNIKSCLHSEGETPPGEEPLFIDFVKEILDSVLSSNNKFPR